MKNKYKPDGWAKFNDWTEDDLAPLNLAHLRDAIRTGDTFYSERLYRTMSTRWLRLKKCLKEKADKVTALPFAVSPWAARGEKPTPQAQELADLIEDALWTRDDKGATKWTLSLSQLLGSLVHAQSRGLAVYQVVRRYDTQRQLWQPVSYSPLLPSYYGWSTSSGEPDELLFYPDGQWSGRGSKLAGGQEFPRDEFIIAMNKTGVDHPIFSSEFMCLIAWFGAATYGLRWFQQYCQAFSLPFLLAKCQNPDSISVIADDLAEARQAGFYATTDEVSMEIVSASSNQPRPQIDLINMADTQCAELILGQNLTSNQGDTGSQALGNVHEGVRSDFVDSAARFVMEIVNSQLIPMIIRWNYGHDFGGQLPSLTLPEEKGTVDRVAYLKSLVELGLPVSKQFALEYLDAPAPAEGDELLSPPQPAAPPFGFDEVAASLRAPKMPPPRKKQS